MKRCISILTITMLLLLGVCGAAYAAPGTQISNTLDGTFYVALAKGVKAEDFSVGEWSGVIGVNVGFTLQNATMQDVTSIAVSLYQGDTLMQTNTAVIEKFNPNQTELSCPFDFFGEFDYEGDGFWSEGAWQGVPHVIPPTKAKIEVEFNDGTTAAVENTNLSGDFSSIVPWKSLIALKWGEEQQFNVNTNFQVSVTAESKYIIDKVLYIVEITGGTPKSVRRVGDEEDLGYKDGYWYWGPSSGFTFNFGSTTTTFEVEADPGTYMVDIYAVRL